MDKHIEQARADRAKLLLEDPLIAEALEEMKANIHTAWEQSPARDTDGREHLYRYTKVIAQFEGALRRHMETGQIIAADIRAEEERKNILERTMERIRG